MKNIETNINENLSHIERFILNKSCNRFIFSDMFSFNKEKFELCSLNNAYKLYINNFNYSTFNINDRSDLCNKYVVYMIYTEDGIYVGQTKDFNERMHSHIKDAAETDRNLYDSLRNRKNGFIVILHTFELDENDTISREVEKLYLEEVVTIRENHDYLKNHIFNMLR